MHPAIEEIVEGLRDEITEMLLQAVKYPTINPPGNEEQLAAFLAGRLVQEGIVAELQEVLPGRPNVLGYLKFGEGGRRLVFNSHMDVVPTGEEPWAIPPFEPVIQKGLLYSRGSADAKGSLIAMLAACYVLKRLNPKISGELMYCGVVGEETGGMGTEYWVRQGYRADAAIVGEPTNLRLVIAHRGAYRPHIRFYGKAAHSSEPEKGENAIYYACNFIQAVRDLNIKMRVKDHPLVGPPSIAATIIRGGNKVNVIPDACEVTLDWRLIPGERHEEAEVELAALLKALQQKDAISAYEIVTYLDNKEAAQVSLDSEIVRVFRRVLADFNRHDPPTGMRATTDMYLLTAADIPTVIFGPGDMSQAHRTNEYIPLEQVIEAVKIYAAAALYYLSGDNAV